MNISQASLALLLLYAAFLGTILGAVYDVLRLTRVFLGVHYSRRMAKRLRAVKLPLLPPRKVRGESSALGTVMFFEDLFFCLFAGVALILLFYQLNNGKFRFSAILCIGGGFLLYRGTVGRLVMLFSEAIAFFVDTALRYLWFFTLFPFLAVWRFVKRNTKTCLGRIARVCQKRSRVRYTETQRTQASFDACGMLPGDSLGTRTLKRGKRYGAGRKKTVQSEHCDPDPFGAFGGDLHRNFREQSDACQRAEKRGSGS